MNRPITTTLHIFSAPPTDNTCLQQCLDCLGVDDAIILIEDGAYFTLPAHIHKLPQTTAIYVLSDDCRSRGVTPDKRCTQANYLEFVQLSLQHHKSISWF